VSLEIQVGSVASCAGEDDPDTLDTLEYLTRDFELINRALQGAGVPVHVEPSALPELEWRSEYTGFPYSYIHYLRRVVAHALHDPGWRATPLAPDDDPTEDPLLIRELESLRSHVICHSDVDGYYVPVDFASPILMDHEDMHVGLILGSSQRVLHELGLAAPALGIELQGGRLSDKEAERLHGGGDESEPLAIEKIVWLTLYEAARLSVEHRTAIRFG
jgi:hypothetical protein